MIEGWRYYNHAMLPSTAPNEPVNLTPLQDGSIWSGGGVLARWTSDFDCGYETNWWWVIKDTPFDISALKAKRRYEIRKGQRNFEVRQIQPAEFTDELLRVQIAAFSAYPDKYRPNVDKCHFINDVKQNWGDRLVYGAFNRETGNLSGYAWLTVFDTYANFNVLKTDPKDERLAINAAIVYNIIGDFDRRLREGFFIVDGERSISHETAFQDYLEKYFDFRKAYCELNVIYKPVMNAVVKSLFPIRKLLNRFDNNKALHSVNAVLKMEEIRRGI